MAAAMDEDSLQDLYSWVDTIHLSRAKRNIARDFSDGVLVAEVVKFHFPKLVEMHNYTPASSTQQKLNNWAHLNRKVFNKLNFYIPDDVVRKVAQCSPGVVELVLSTLRLKIGEKLKQKQSKMASSPQDLEYYSTAMEQDLVSDITVKRLRNREPALSSTTSCPPSIKILQVKVRRLEHLLYLKDVRIDDLTRRVRQAEQR
uniref:sperm flagellar protein 1-like isoform X3 n=1 Tax=Pristiophorus japonicus TaxID=55135 RepID=UPI00398E991D